MSFIAIPVFPAAYGMSRLFQLKTVLFDIPKDVRTAILEAGIREEIIERRDRTPRWPSERPPGLPAPPSVGSTP